MESSSIVKPEKMIHLEQVPLHPQVPRSHPPPINSTVSPHRTKNHIESNDGSAHENKKRRVEEPRYVLPPGFLQPLPPLTVVPPSTSSRVPVNSCKQFWKAGDYEVPSSSSFSSGGLDHIRVHPKFLHSNATSHKWALGAFAELLDNSVDEVCHGATYVNVDMLENDKDKSKMLLFADNGGGMNVDTIRHCMSFGYSAKSKVANTIGQYGNGFKTSTMRLGADVIVFSRCLGKDGKRATQSIGMLSYSFLRDTGKDDIVVPILDYEKSGSKWNEIIRSSCEDWNKNLETILLWSPYCSEVELLHQFDLMEGQGTRVVIYNLWEDEQGELELDFDTDPSDIQIRGVNRDEVKIEMAKNFPNSRHFLTYHHSLRSYTSILYLRLPKFRITIRGVNVEHHNLVNDMMLVKKSTYRPVAAEGALKNSNLSTDVTLGFVKDAKEHIDVQGFNVYHKNRLIKPFWRVWNAAGSDGRGVIGVLEADFIEPAHDKQGFENTPILQRLHTKLVNMQKEYWREKCHEIGYAPRHKKGRSEPEDQDVVTCVKDSSPQSISSGKRCVPLSREKKQDNNIASKRPLDHLNENLEQCVTNFQTEYTDTSCNGRTLRPHMDVQPNSQSLPLRQWKGMEADITTNIVGVERPKSTRLVGSQSDALSSSEDAIISENMELKERLKSLEDLLMEKEQKIKEQDKETESLIDIFSEERNRRDEEEARLRKKFQTASAIIEELRDKLKELEKANSSIIKQESR